MSRPHSNNSGFTLVELLAVVLVIAVLVGIILGVAGTVRTKMGVSQAKAEICALEVALEAYKADNGFFPASTSVRLSYTGRMEVSNSWLLVHALTSGPKQYLRLSSNQMVNVDGLWVFGDPWRRPYNYYCPNPKPTTTAITNFYTGASSTVLQERWLIGGQVNVASFDLISFGPDGRTYGGSTWTNASSSHDQPRYALDDVTNYK